MIYLDFNATTPVDPLVLQEMVPWFTDTFGNPSSAHAPGRRAAGAIAEAREVIGGLLRCDPSRIVFTSGATEANNLALKGALGTDEGPRHIITTAAEHKSILEAAASVPAATVDVISVDAVGRIDLDELRSSLDRSPAVVSVVAANNEVGTLNPIIDIAELVHRAGSLLHTDATQWVGKLPIDVDEWDVDLLSFSAHKMYGPKGVGALYVRQGIHLEALLTGGGQERGIRGGTLNVPGIVGFAAAASLARELLASEPERMRTLRDRLLHSLQDQVGGIS